MSIYDHLPSKKDGKFITKNNNHVYWSIKYIPPAPELMSGLMHKGEYILIVKANLDHGKKFERMFYIDKKDSNVNDDEMLPMIIDEVNKFINEKTPGLFNI